MADYKQLCVELLSELENAIGVIYGEDGTRHISSADAVITKADAALDEPIAGPVGGNYREAWDMSSKDGSLCFASAILSRLVGGVLDQADVRWLAAYLQANSTPQPVAVSDDLRHLVRFMCQTWVEIDKWARMFGAAELDTFPVIQGSRNQMNLRQIAAQPCDSERVAIGVQLMLSPEVIVQPLPITPPAGQEAADVQL